MSEIFIVMGESKTYEDRRTWPVAAYEIKDLAEEHRRLANKASNEIERYNEDDATGAVNPYDPDWVCIDADWDVPNYEVLTLPIDTEAPETARLVKMPDVRKPTHEERVAERFKEEPPLNLSDAAGDY